MTKRFFLRLFALVILASCSWNGMLLAQSQNAQGPTMTVAIDGLTSEVRDGIARDLKGHSDLRLVYACVPAGIMVFEQLNERSREQMRASLTPVLEHRVARQKIHLPNMDRSTAEERCAQVRNR